MSRISAILILALGVLSLALATPRAAVLEPEPYFGEIAQVLADGLPKTHITHQEFDDVVAYKAFSNFLASLDFDRTVFFADEVDTFAEHMTDLDDLVKEGRIDTAYDVFDLFLNHMSNRVGYVKELLDEGFDLTVDETYQMDRRGAPWPASGEERDDLWRRKIKNEYLARVVNKQIKKEQREASKAAGEDPVDEEEEEDDEDPSKEKFEKLTPEEQIIKNYERMMTVLGSHDAEWVLQQYLNAFAHAYDTHTTYMSRRASEDFEISMKLSLTGIGALLSTEDGFTKIVRLIPGGPAEQDGRLKAGDRIVAVAQGDGEAEDIMYKPLYQTVRKIRGEIGTKVVLSVIPADDPTGTEIEKIDLIREEIKLEEQKAKSRVREVPGEKVEEAHKLGIIRLPDFYADQRGQRNGEDDPTSSARDVKDLLLELMDENVEGVLLDLRHNGGGSLPDAISMTGHFIDQGPVVQVKANRRVKVIPDPEKGVVYDGPLVVLVNRQSASASEILAAALQDHGRAVIVGDSHTHGKGSVQSVLPLNRKRERLGQLKVTTAGFYRIDGRTTQLKGLEPDIIIPSRSDAMRVGEKYLPNVLALEDVTSAHYDKLMDVTPYLPALKSKSLERRARDERYEKFEEVIQHLRERLDAKEITLNKENRLAMAREDKATEDTLNEMLEEDLGDDDEAVAEEASTFEIDPPLEEQLAGSLTASIISGDDEEELSEEEKAAKEEEKALKKDKKDLVLIEAMNILRDLVEIQHAAAKGDIDVPSIADSETLPEPSPAESATSDL